MMSQSWLGSQTGRCHRSMDCQFWSPTKMMIQLNSRWPTKWVPIGCHITITEFRFLNLKVKRLICQTMRTEVCWIQRNYRKPLGSTWNFQSLKFKPLRLDLESFHISLIFPILRQRGRSIFRIYLKVATCISSQWQEKLWLLEKLPMRSQECSMSFIRLHGEN